MDFFYDIARYAYLHNALAACILSGIACGIMGTYVVCRRTVFLAGGITHASFGGLGIAFYLGQELTFDKVLERSSSPFSRRSASNGRATAAASARIRPSASSGRSAWRSAYSS